MVTVDSLGRIVLPQSIRDRLGLTPGTEVTISEADGKMIIEPEVPPQQIIDRMEALIEEPETGRSGPVPRSDVSPIAKKHRDAIRRGAAQHTDDESAE
ncbi:AbrB/MazE/SpoVT family DNA-binding domain-containing protein (plasmid) [Haloferax larsenii]|uniref:AbrB/MazE/SpoVT family DNA-binding domain-containing protein n=1 Tax=Haloferax larsenii TaxID=302484 RepID=A0ABY5RI75_HALLR|nr:AbrB/MazE/SpoVT family DNA-binding domain-containing protein [Haloferax larsenii]UVE52041.1 AbrB/MazE/SpoVT family DNA-binding domain-containing protein [Haloferax larsenii]